MYYLFIDNELTGYFSVRLQSHGGIGTGSAHKPILAALACDSSFITSPTFQLSDRTDLGLIGKGFFRVDL